MSTMDVDGSSLPADSQPKSVGWSEVGGHFGVQSIHIK